MIYPYTYWKAPELPLHKVRNDRSLRWNHYAIDKSLCWFFFQFDKLTRGSKPLIVKKYTSYGQRLFSDNDILLLSSFESWSRPDWIKDKTRKTKFNYKSSLIGDYTKKYYFLPQDKHCKGFLFLQTPIFTRSYVDWSDRDSPNASCLAFVEDEGGWVLYPRSLLYSTYPGNFKSRIGTKFLTGKRGAAWLEGVRSLPDYAWSLREGREGKPYTKYSNVEEDYEFDNKREDIFWKHCALSLLALFAIHGECPPEWDKNQFFKKSVHYSLNIPDDDPLKMKIEFDWYLWDRRYSSSQNIPDHPVPSRWAEKSILIKEDFKNLILKMAPKTPYFFENSGPRDDIRSFDYCTTDSYLLPWCDISKDIPLSASSHGVFEILKHLPPEWQAQISTLMQKRLE